MSLGISNLTKTFDLITGDIENIHLHLKMLKNKEKDLKHESGFPLSHLAGDLDVDKMSLAESVENVFNKKRSDILLADLGVGSDRFGIHGGKIAEVSELNRLWWQLHGITLSIT